jgi:hypothetical protein
MIENENRIKNPKYPPKKTGPLEQIKIHFEFLVEILQYTKNFHIPASMKTNENRVTGKSILATGGWIHMRSLGDRVI